MFRKQGVTDPTEASILRAAARLGVRATGAKTGTAYVFAPAPDAATLRRIGETLLANAAVEDLHVGDDRFPDAREPKAHVFRTASYAERVRIERRRRSRWNRPRSTFGIVKIRWR